MPFRVIKNRKVIHRCQLPDLAIPEVEISGENRHTIGTCRADTGEAVLELLHPGFGMLPRWLQVSVEQCKLQGANVCLQRQNIKWNPRNEHLETTSYNFFISVVWKCTSISCPEYWPQHRGGSGPWKCVQTRWFGARQSRPGTCAAALP